MSGGFGLPVLNLQSALGQLGESYDAGRRRGALEKLGTQLGGGDWKGAASTAFDAGDAATGLGLLKLGHERDKEARQQANSAALFGSGGIPALYGGDGGLSSLGAEIGLPGSGSRSDAGGSRSVPSFLSDSGVMGDYLASTRARESGGNDLAANPNSSARGRYQITDGTWSGLARKHPDLGLTPGGRTDPAQQEKAMAALTGDNARSLTDAGLPINPTTLYGAHFLGEGGAKRFFHGASNRPDAPAVNFVSEGAARANRSVFFNRDGSPKSAGEVLAWMGGRKGGAGAPMQVASADPEADLPVPGAVEASARQPGLVDFAVPAGAGSIPPSLSENAYNLPPSGGASTIPTLGDVPNGGRPMTMPGEEPPAQVAQNTLGGPPVTSDATVRGIPAQRIAGFRPSERVQFLLRASALDLPEAERGIVSKLLENALAETKLPDTVKEFVWARAHGMTRAATPAEYKRELEGDQNQFIQANGRVLYGNKATGAVRDATPEGLPPTWRPLTAAERQSLGVRDDAAVYMTPDGPKSISGQTINVNGGERAQDAAIGADYGKRFVEMQRGAAVSRSTLGTIDTMERAMNSGTFYSGTGGPARLAFNRALESVGIKDKGGAAPAEVFEALSNKLILDGLGGSLGTGISNGDRDFIQRTAPDLAKTPAGNRQLLGYARALAQRQQDIAKLSREYAGRNGGRLDPGFDDALADWAEKNPLFSGNRRSGSDAPRQDRPASAPAGAPSSGAIDFLRQNPNLRGDFDAKYGAGAADHALGAR